MNELDIGRLYIWAATPQRPLFCLVLDVKPGWVTAFIGGLVSEWGTQHFIESWVGDSKNIFPVNTKEKQ